MAFGIDDALMTAAAGLRFSDTLVQTVKAYRKADGDLDVELLIEEVRVTTLQRLDESDAALAQFERMLGERNIDADRSLKTVIESTPWWRPHEAHRLKRIQRSFNALADATYAATDDVAALLRCKQRTGPMGGVVVESASSKHRFLERLLEAPTVRQSIRILRAEMTRLKDELR
ncbi:MAG: hypothetical protein IT437_08550 [Phycisphaerales bacterium]|nr:hypothetical protein [Phycisphaerales bacterium]